VRDLIRDRVHSIEDLETLLLLHAEPVREWSAAEVAEELKILEGAADAALSTLAQVGLIRDLSLGAAHKYRYEPEDGELAAQVQLLAESYRDYRVETLVMIASHAIGRVRRDALATFAEAFRLRGSKKDG
jgi:hypothetical protein